MNENRTLAAKAEQQKAATNTHNWANWIEQRIVERTLDRDMLYSILGEIVARERTTTRNEIKTAVDEARRAVETKLATKLEALEQRIAQRIDQLIIARDGKASPEAVARFVGERIEEPLYEFIRTQIDTKFAALEQRLKDMPGKLPVAKIWRPETVVYQNEFATHEGALWQARRDTAQRPGGADWARVARAGRDATSPTIRGTYNANESYKALDVVAMDGGSFISRRDNPSGMPGQSGDWQLIARQGKRGHKGETGERGPRGHEGPAAVMPQLISSEIDKDYNLILRRSDGTREVISLHAAFAHFYHQIINQYTG